MSLFKQYLEKESEKTLFPQFNPKINDLRNKVNKFKVYNNIISYFSKHKTKLPFSDSNWKPTRNSKKEINLESNKTIIFDIPFVNKYKNNNLYLRFLNNSVEILYITQSTPNFSLNILEDNKIIEFKENKDFYSKLLNTIKEIFDKNKNKKRKYSPFPNPLNKYENQPRLIGKPLFTEKEINEIIKDAINKSKNGK